MNCAMWEERVALLAGGDLDRAEAAGAVRHLEECARCRALGEDLHRELDRLRAVHAEPFEAECYSAVRGRVLAELAKPPHGRAAWAWAAGLAVAAAAAAFVSITTQPQVPAPELPRLVAAAPAVQGQGGIDRSLTVAAPKRVQARTADSPSTTRIKPARTHTSAGRGPAAPEVADAPVRTVQLATADPNVVIYWLFEGKEEER
jgi:hypothetical protein